MITPKINSFLLKKIILVASFSTLYMVLYFLTSRLPIQHLWFFKIPFAKRYIFFIYIYFVPLIIMSLYSPLYLSFLGIFIAETLVFYHRKFSITFSLMFSYNPLFSLNLAFFLGVLPKIFLKLPFNFWRWCFSLCPILFFYRLVDLLLLFYTVKRSNFTKLITFLEPIFPNIYIFFLIVESLFCFFLAIFLVIILKKILRQLDSFWPQFN